MAADNGEKGANDAHTGDRVTKKKAGKNGGKVGRTKKHKNVK